MKLFTFYKRLLTFEKYPLFRTANFKHMLLNIFVISLLIALPNIIALFQSANAAAGLADIESEIPEFSIVDGQYVGEDETVSIKGNDVLFSSEVATDSVEDRNVLIGFVKDGIYIRDVQNTGFDYSYIGDVKDDEGLKTFISQQSSSLYFYVSVYVVFFIFVVMFFSVIFMSILAYLFHTSSVLLKRKSRFMNWYKFISFATAFILLPMALVELLSGSMLWSLYLLTLPFYIHYFRKLPVMKT